MNFETMLYVFAIFAKIEMAAVLIAFFGGLILSVFFMMVLAGEYTIQSKISKVILAFLVLIWCCSFTLSLLLPNNTTLDTVLYFNILKRTKMVKMYNIISSKTVNYLEHFELGDNKHEN